MQKEFDVLDVLGLTFESKTTLEMHLNSVSWASSQRLGIIRRSCRVFIERLLLERFFPCFYLPVLSSIVVLGINFFP